MNIGLFRAFIVALPFMTSLSLDAWATPAFPPVTNEIFVASQDVDDPDWENNKFYDDNASPPGEDSIRLFKDALTPNAVVGDTLEWRIHGIVDFPFDLIKPKIVDVLPIEQTFVPNSITVAINGAEASAMVTLGPGGFVLEFPVLPTGSTFEVKFKTVLNVAYEEDTTINRTHARITDLFQVSNHAEAVVEIGVEPVFDCATLIGRVFRDTNGNGYADAGERGIAGTRLVALTPETALTIDADSDGRYHLPCSVVPKASVGSNFIVKLDTRTLPAGATLSTENPRVVRLTRGKMSKADFGVLLARSVRMDINDCLFSGNFFAGTAGTEEGLRTVVEQLAASPSKLKIVMRTGLLRDEDINARFVDVVQRVDRHWQDIGSPYELSVESEIVRHVGGGLVCN